MGKNLNGKELGSGISQRKDKTYVGRFVNRFGKRVAIYDKNLSNLRKRISKAKYEDQKKTNLVDDKILLDDWYEKWINIYKKGEIRDSTKLVYDQVYKTHISPILGNFELAEITNLQIKDMLNTLKNVKGLGYQVRNKARIILIDMYTKAQINELVVKNPVVGIKITKENSNHVRVLTKEEQFEFLNCASGTFYSNMFEVQIFSGLRPGEMYALRESDLNFENETIAVNRTLLYQKLDGDTKKTFHIHPPKTKQSRRVVPMSKKCKAALQRQVLQRRIVMSKTSKKIPEEFKDLLFVTKYGTPINTQIYSDAIKKIINEINLMKAPIEMMENFSPHCFRHTFATRCFESGIELKIIQKYLGHATLQMTADLYTHVSENFAETELPKLDNYLAEIDKIEPDLISSRIKDFEKYDNKIIDFKKIVNS